MIFYNLIAIAVCYFILIKTMNPIIPAGAYLLYKGVLSYFFLFSDPTMGMMVLFAVFFLILSTVLIYGMGLLVLKKTGKLKYIGASLMSIPILLF